MLLQDSLSIQLKLECKPTTMIQCSNVSNIHTTKKACEVSSEVSPHNSPRKPLVLHHTHSSCSGIIPPLITVSIIKSVSFSVYEETKKFLRERSALFNGDSLMSVAAISTLGGAASGSFIATLSCPLELVKIQKQLEQLLLTSSMATGGTIVRGENVANGSKVGIQRTDVTHKVGAGLPIIAQSVQNSPGSASRPAKIPNTVLPPNVAGTTEKGSTNLSSKVVPIFQDLPKQNQRPKNGPSTSSWYSAREIVRLKGISGLWSGFPLHFCE